MSEPFANYVKDDEARGKKCKAREYLVPCTYPCEEDVVAVAVFVVVVVVIFMVLVGFVCFFARCLLRGGLRKNANDKKEK
jgi:Ni,Fe-hydrogenase I cytochrome b subunit